MLNHQMIFKNNLSSTHQRLLFASKKVFAIDHAYQLFDESPQRTFYSLTNCMLTYINQNLSSRALNVFKTELHDNYRDRIDEDVVAVAVKASCGDRKTGMMLHSFA